MSVGTRLSWAAESSQKAAQVYYNLTSRYSSDRLVFLNLGYEEDPPMRIPLEPADEADRYPIQMYHATATQTGLAGKRVLEVSCGHGGGASYLMRTLKPATYTGLDLNKAGIRFCRRRHHIPGLDFVHGNAEHLPFEDGSFDAVINIEAASYYPNYRRFLAEVKRVLTPGGHFLYTDLRPRPQIPEWEQALADSGMRIECQRDISQEVARGLELNTPRMKRLNARYIPDPIVDKSFTGIRRNMVSGQSSYRMYHLTVDTTITA